MATIKKGAVLSFSGGEYSDKWTSGPFTVLRDFDQERTVVTFRLDGAPRDCAGECE